MEAPPPPPEEENIRSRDRDSGAENIHSFLAHAWTAAKRHGLEISARPDPETMNAVLVAQLPAGDTKTGGLSMRWGIEGLVERDFQESITESYPHFFMRLVYDAEKDFHILLFCIRDDAEWHLHDASIPEEAYVEMHKRIGRALDPERRLFVQKKLSRDEAYALIERMCALCAEKPLATP